MKKCWECLDASPDAIEGESVVGEMYISGRGSLIVPLPKELIGKRVGWIIEVIEEGE